MSKPRKSNREAKKEPAMTMKEKRAAKNSKKAPKILSGIAKATRTPAPVSGTKRP